MTGATVSAEGKRILRHALGLTDSRRPYRNHYVAGPGHDSMPELEKLEALGFVERVPTPGFCPPSDIVFIVTVAGIHAAKSR